MNTAKLVKWGNSIGIRIPAKELKKMNAYLGEEFNLTAHSDGSLILTPIHKPQEQWLEAFNKIADAKNEEPLINSAIQNNFDQDEWTW